MALISMGVTLIPLPLWRYDWSFVCLFMTNVAAVAIFARDRIEPHLATVEWGDSIRGSDAAAAVHAAEGTASPVLGEPHMPAHKAVDDKAELAAGVAGIPQDA